MDDKQRREARILFSDFNRFRLQTGGVEKRRAAGQYIGVFKETPERLELFHKTAEWCRGKQIDPRLWIYLLFRARMWTFAPQMVPHHLMSENMVAKYEALENQALDGYRIHIQKAYGKDKPFDPNYEISHAAEATKKRYAQIGDRQRCMRETVERTLGFHPKSSTCQACPIKMQCADALRKMIPEFDIIELREGKITPEQAQAKVQSGG